MTVGLDTINGVAVGIEFVPAIEEEGIANTVILDLFIIRLLFQWPVE